MPTPRTGRPRGRPKGTKLKKTLEKEEARRVLREMVIEEMGPMIAAQIENAKGIKYLVARSKKGGRFVRLEHLPKPGEQVGADDEIIEVWAKDPSIQAFADLMNRALDKPVQQHDVNVPGLTDIASVLNEGRERVTKLRKRGNSNG